MGGSTKKLYTPEEIGEMIKARREQGISQRKLEEMGGVKQPIIASEVTH
jgi:predicted transcriptional regulator